MWVWVWGGEVVWAGGEGGEGGVWGRFGGGGVVVDPPPPFAPGTTRKRTIAYNGTPGNPLNNFQGV